MTFYDETLYGRDDEMDDYGEGSSGESLNGEEYEEEEEEEEPESSVVIVEEEEEVEPEAEEVMAPPPAKKAPSKASPKKAAKPQVVADQRSQPRKLLRRRKPRPKRQPRKRRPKSRRRRQQARRHLPRSLRRNRRKKRRRSRAPRRRQSRGAAAKTHTKAADFHRGFLSLTAFVLRQSVQVLDKRSGRAIDARNLRVGRLDDVVLVGRVRTRAMSHTKMSRRQAERQIGEDVAWPRTSRARPHHGIFSQLLVGCHLSLDKLGIGRRLVGIIAAAHVDLDVAEALLREIVLQQLQCPLRRHVGNQAHVNLRDRSMRQHSLAARSGVSGDQAFDVDRRLRFQLHQCIVERFVAIPVE